MKLNEISELYALMSEGTENISSHRQTIALRKSSFNNILQGTPIVKFAFDTRRVNQESEFISRRGLQNYNRSDAFISEAISERLVGLKKIKQILDDLKDQYGKEKEWLDSYCRILLDTVNKSLRTEQQDEEYTDTQQSVGSLDYLEEMLYVRYRLELNNIINMDIEDIKKSLLGKDKELINKKIIAKDNNDVSISKYDVAKESYDTLLEKLFGNIKDNCERTVTITIKNTIKDE